MEKFYKPVSVDLDFSFIYDVDWESHKKDIYLANAISDLQKLHKNFPNTYTPHNTVFYQKLDIENHVDLKLLNKQLGIDGKKVTVIKQPPGMILPIHLDTFYQIGKLYPEDSRMKVRANIFLEDWKWGHVFQVEDRVISHWKKNSGYMWNSETLHLAANVGLEPRYSLQVSGFLINS